MLIAKRLLLEKDVSMPIKQVSSQAGHYDYSADKYDAMYEHNQEIDDALLAKILKKKKVTSVLDLSCGTGQQLIHRDKK